MLTINHRFRRRSFFIQALSLWCALFVCYAPLPFPKDNIAPRTALNGNGHHADADLLTYSFLDRAENSPDPNVRELAELILSQQKNPLSGVIVTFAAAFFASFPFIGQEIILRNTTILDYLFLQPFITFLILLAPLFANAGKRWLRFFPLLWKHAALKWYFLQFLSHQIIRNMIFFYVLPKIGSTGVSMIAATCVFFTPLLEWFLLNNGDGKNKLKISYVFCYSLIFFGVVGYKFTSLPGLFLFSLAVVHYLLSSFESIFRKKITNAVNGDGHSAYVPLVLVTWNYFLSSFFWGITWLSLPFWKSALPVSEIFSSATPVSQLAVLFSSPLLLILVLTSGLLAGYRYFEIKAINIPSYPVSVHESLLQTRIIVTALFVSGIVFLSAQFPLLATLHFSYPTASQWLFIPLILLGVFLLAKIQLNEDKKANGEKVTYGPKKKPLTHRDWKEMLQFMRKTAVRNPEHRARLAWDKQFGITHNKYRKKTVFPLPLSEVSL